MGQQLSSENYCISTIQRLAEELNTTDSQVSECNVLSSSGNSVKLQFSWREWRRVSGHLERVLPTGEQRRLLDHLLLDVTGLRSADLGALWEATVGISSADDDEDNEVFIPPPTSVEDAAETPSVSLDATGTWTVHPDWTEEGARGNPLLYRDFAKVHLQLDPVFSVFNLELTQTLGTPHSSVADGDEISPQQQYEEVPEEASSVPSFVSIYGYRSSRRIGGVGTADLRAFVAGFADRVAELVRAQCAKLGVSFLITACQYHPMHNCLVLSGTADVRSLLRQSGGIELRSWANDSAEGQELTDQLQRSIGRGFDGFREREAARQGRQARDRYFPMLMYYCEARKLVTVIYSLVPKETDD